MKTTHQERDKMKISVIVPFYHGNQYIDNLFTMVKNNQFYLKNIPLEIVIVNDSPDEEISIQECFNDLDILVANNKQNVGIHKSRLNGLKICHGEYVLFLDQDDFISDDCLLSHIKCIGDGDFSVSNGYLLGLDGSKKPIYNSDKHQNCCLNLNFHYGYTNPIISPGQVLLKKEAIPKQWTEHIFKKNGADDHYLWLLLLEQGKRGVINRKYVYTHVSTGSNTSLDIQGMCDSNKELISLMHGISNNYRLHMLKRRVLYNGNSPEKLLTKIKFIDVALARKYYGRLIR